VVSAGIWKLTNLWRRSEQQWSQIGKTLLIDALLLIGRCRVDPGELADNMAFVVRPAVDHTKIDPSKYKEMFDNPVSFDEAWNHQCKFQWTKWREAAIKEFTKMGLKKV
jgi:hypothetical protein